MSVRRIKRYPNRKLYDTEAREYVTLAGIASIIRQGEEVQVVDHVTGEDLTSLTLTQIILEQERKQGGYVPRSLLTGLVRAGGDALVGLSRTLVSPLDLLRQIDEEIGRRLEDLVERGELAEEEGQRLHDKLTGQPFLLPRRSVPSDEELERALSAAGVPTRDEFQRLSEQLRRLAEKLEDLSQDSAS
jgi:polyhydroxyalkanoate synthesis repressor PhaR